VGAFGRAASAAEVSAWSAGGSKSRSTRIGQKARETGVLRQVVQRELAAVPERWRSRAHEWGASRGSRNISFRCSRWEIVTGKVVGKSNVFNYVEIVMDVGVVIFLWKSQWWEIGRGYGIIQGMSDFRKQDLEDAWNTSILARLD
jgi:hypothetical protein